RSRFSSSRFPQHCARAEYVLSYRRLADTVHRRDRLHREIAQRYQLEAGALHRRKLAHRLDRRLDLEPQFDPPAPGRSPRVGPPERPAQAGAPGVSRPTVGGESADDRIKPGCERTLAVEAAGTPVDHGEGLLDHVFRVIAIAEQLRRKERGRAEVAP